eukprot:567174-Alexandrium_andersonii.AAC.1
MHEVVGRVLEYVILLCPLALFVLALLEQIVDHPANDERGPQVRLLVLEPIGPRSVVELVDLG